MSDYKNSMRCYDEEELEIWREAFSEDGSVANYRVVNDSDYSGKSFIIVWNWKNPDQAIERAFGM